MARVIKDGFISLGAIDRSALCESFEPSWDLEIQESRPFSQMAVRKDAGLNNNSFTATFVDDDALTITQWLNDNQSTKVAFVLRYSQAVVSVTNPQWTGQVIVPPTAPPATQGEIARLSVTLQVDGEVTMATA